MNGYVYIHRKTGEMAVLSLEFTKDKNNRFLGLYWSLETTEEVRQQLNGFNVTIENMEQHFISLGEL